jgi:hypothetical protein
MNFKIDKFVMVLLTGREWADVSDVDIAVG